MAPTNHSYSKYVKGQSKNPSASRKDGSTQDNQNEKPYKFVVRLPTEMRDQIAEAADYYRRSMNSEIVARLEQSFSGIIDDATEEQLQPPLHSQLEQMFNRELSKEEEQIIRTFRRLSSDKRAALLQLLN